MMMFVSYLWEAVGNSQEIFIFFTRSCYESLLVSKIHLVSHFFRLIGCEILLLGTKTVILLLGILSEVITDLEVIGMQELQPQLEVHIGSLKQKLFWLSQQRFLHHSQWVRGSPGFMGFIPSQLIRDALVQLLGLFGGTLSDSTQSANQNSAEVRAQPVVISPKVEIPLMLVVAQSQLPILLCPLRSKRCWVDFCY